MRPARRIPLLIVAVVATCGAALASQTSGAGVHDGQWWLSLDADQRTEFVTGYASYYTWKLRGPIAFSASASAYQVRLETRLKANVQDAKLPISELLDDEARTLSSGSAWRGNFAGQYWGELGRPGRVGFVQGFLECQRRDARSTAKFSKAEAWYVDQTTKWFGIDDSHEPDEAQLGTSVIDILTKLDDKERGRPSAGR